MKINKLMLALLAGAMFASCSDDRSNEPLPDTDTVGSQGYIGVSIGMPAQGMSRGQNDNFDDGLESEYYVENAALIFFTGPEASAQFYKAYNINQVEWNAVTDSPNQITQNTIVTFPVNFATESTGSLWALAVINPGSVLQVTDGKLYLGTDETPFTGDIKEFLALTTSQPLSTTNKFFMTNAPHSSVAGTIQGAGEPKPGATFRVLAPVDKSRICATAPAAKELPAAAIFVERAVAKVEVISDKLVVADNAINFPTGFTGNITDVRWNLDNTEPSTFIVRNLVESDYNGTNVPYWAYYDTNTELKTLTHHYRFLGNAGFGHTFWPNTPDPDEHYRTYFGFDPNGIGIDEGNLVVASSATTLTGSGHPLYCYENTFDVEHMDYRNTTRAIIRVDFGGTDSGNLYTVGEDNKNTYIFETAASYLTYAILNDPDAIAAWTAHFEENKEVHKEEYSHEATTADMVYNETNNLADGAWMKVGFNKNTTTGRLTVTSITLKDGHGSEFAFDKSGDVITRVNNSVTIKYYAGGRAYYAVRIRHFGNDLAPWTAPDKTTNTTQDSYSGVAVNDNIIDLQDIKNYLGRYGVLRNNWYVLTLGAINQMGEPVVGDLPLDGTPDDRVLKEESISCRINILSWAKRNQTDDL